MPSRQKTQLFSTPFANRCYLALLLLMALNSDQKFDRGAL